MQHVNLYTFTVDVDRFRLLFDDDLYRKLSIISDLYRLFNMFDEMKKTK